MNCPSQDERRSECTPANCRQHCGRDTVDAMLASERVRSDEGTVDALLEFKFLLVERAKPEQILRAYFDMRRGIERHEFLLAYRLRKWIEHHLEISVTAAGASERRGLDLGFPCLRRLKQSIQREIFENNLEVNGYDEVEVEFLRVAERERVAEAAK